MGSDEFEKLTGVGGKLGLTHLALRCRDTTTTANFYAAVCGMDIVHKRDGDDMPVYWVSARSLGIDFVLVLMGGGKEGPNLRLDHLGLTVESRDSVDRIAEKARQLGILHEGPHDLGPPVGYFCVIRDPDGNGVEFSHDQDIVF